VSCKQNSCPATSVQAGRSSFQYWSELHTLFAGSKGVPGDDHHLHAVPGGQKHLCFWRRVVFVEKYEQHNAPILFRFFVTLVAYHVGLAKKE